MKIKWNGHSCFTVTMDSGLTLVTDPFDPSVGYPCPTDSADIVTISHGHHDHNFTDTLTGAKALIEDVGRHEENGVAVTGYPSAHDHHGGEKRGKNVVFEIEAEGKRIFHLGDLGCLPSEELYAAMEGADLVLLPIGGYFTIDTDEAVSILRRVHAKAAIPMHYKTEVIRFPIEDERRFEQITGAKRAGSREIELTSDFTGVWILDYPVSGDEMC